MMLDDFETSRRGRRRPPTASRRRLRPADGDRGGALCIDFDFGRVTGYVARAARRCRSSFRRATSSRCECAATRRRTRCRSSSSMRAAPTSGGAARTSSAFRAEWQTLRFRQREIEFAWGPDGRPRAAAERLDRAGDRVRQRRRQGQRLLRSARAARTAGERSDAARRRRRRPRRCRVTAPAHAVDGQPATDWQPAERARRRPC